MAPRVQIRDVPEPVHWTLKARAALAAASRGGVRRAGGSPLPTADARLARAAVVTNAEVIVVGD